MDVYRNNGIQVIGVSFDTPEENRAFTEKFDFPFPLWSDTSRSLALAYGAAEDASAAYAGRVGVVLYETGSVVHHYPSASARTFALDVLRDLGLDGEIQ